VAGLQKKIPFNAPLKLLLDRAAARTTAFGPPNEPTIAVVIIVCKHCPASGRAPAGYGCPVAGRKSPEQSL